MSVTCALIVFEEFFKAVFTASTALFINDKLTSEEINAPIDISIHITPIKISLPFLTLLIIRASVSDCGPSYALKARFITVAPTVPPSVNAPGLIPVISRPPSLRHSSLESPLAARASVFR